MKKERIIAMLLVLLLAMGMLVGCGEKKEDEKVIRVAYFPNITHTQALIMKEQQTLEKTLGDGWKIEWLDFVSGTSEMEAVFAGEVDLGYIGPVPAVSGNVKSNGDVQVIAGATNGGSLLVAAKDSGIKTFADLAGKTVAIPSIGNTQHLLLVKMMADNNMKATSEGGTVNVKAVANSDTISLMEAGEIDAALVPEPWGSTLAAKVSADIILDYKDIWKEDNGNYSTTVVIGRKDFMEEKSDVVSKFLEAHTTATNYIEENPEEAAGIVNKQIKEVTGKELEEDILTQAFARIIPSVEIPKASIMKYASASKEQNLIPSMPEESTLFNETYVK